MQYYIANAFTTDPYGGNPAAVIVVDAFPDEDIMQKIAKNLNQPMTSYIRLTQSDAHAADFDIRWFTPVIEIPLCGHATIVSAKVVFTIPGLLPDNVTTLRFHSARGKTLTVQQDSEWIGMTLVAAEITQLSDVEVDKLRTVLSRGLGREVTVKFAGAGRDAFDYYLLAEIDEADDLAACKPVHSAFLDTGYTVNIITTSSSDAEVAFVSRMFAPAAGCAEDHVCGSAHCLLTPYWSKKLDKGENQMIAHQVSERGGVLKVAWKQSEGLLAIAGQAVAVMKGELL